MDVTVEPAGQGGTKEADDGKREEVKRTESGDQRSMAKQRSGTEGHEDDAENNAYTGIELDEQAEKMETKKKDEGTGDGSECIAILFEENADGTGGCSKRYEHNGKAGDEGE